MTHLYSLCCVKDLKGILKRLIAESKQQLSRTVFSRLHSRIPNKISAIPPNSSLLRRGIRQEWCTLLRHTSFTLSRWLVRTFWSLRLISSPSHRPSTFELCDLLMPLSQASGASKLCRWLGGSVQRIQHSLFYSVIFLQIIFLFLVGGL